MSTDPQAEASAIHRDGRRNGSASGPSPDELRTVVDRHAAAVYRVALSIVHDSALADDVVQETMIKAWRHSPVGPGEVIPRSWLLKVAHNTAISLLRVRREDLHDPGTLPEPPGEIETDRRVEGKAQLDDLWKAMEHLDEAARILIALREVDGLSYEEMSDTLELPIPTIKTRLFRARRQLKDALKEWR